MVVLSIDSVIHRFRPLRAGSRGIGAPRRGCRAPWRPGLRCQVADLAGSHPHPAHFAEHRTDLIVDRAGHLLPRCIQVGTALVDVGPAGIGEHVRATLVDLLGADQALVLELGERWVDRPWARPPDAVRTSLDLSHDLVAVQRSLRQEQQRGRADVATAGPRPAWKPARPPEKGAESFPAEGPRPVPTAAPSRPCQRRRRRPQTEQPTRTADTPTGPP